MGYLRRTFGILFALAMAWLACGAPSAVFADARSEISVLADLHLEGQPPTAGGAGDGVLGPSVAGDEHGACQGGQCVVYLPSVAASGPELGAVTGRIISAVNVQAISGATVCVLSTNQCASTTSQGTYVLVDVPAGSQTLRVAASGYAVLEQAASVPADGTTTLNFALSPVLAEGEMRIVLTWGERPQDLDSHLWLPASTPYHLYFANKGSCTAFPNACLVIDDQLSYGPETITLKQRYAGTYVFAVMNWSDEGVPLTQSNGLVQVYGANGLLAQVAVPASGEGRWWYVFDLDGATGQLTPRNVVQATAPAPYLVGGELVAK